MNFLMPKFSQSTIIHYHTQLIVHAILQVFQLYQLYALQHSEVCSQIQLAMQPSLFMYAVKLNQTTPNKFLVSCSPPAPVSYQHLTNSIISVFSCILCILHYTYKYFKAALMIVSVFNNTLSWTTIPWTIYDLQDEKLKLKCSLLNFINYLMPAHGIAIE